MFTIIYLIDVKLKNKWKEKIMNENNNSNVIRMSLFILLFKLDIYIFYKSISLIKLIYL